MSLNRARVLIYHKINDDIWDTQLLSVKSENFYNQLLYIQENYEPISLDSLISRLKDNNLSGNEVSITFDDGYLDNLSNMLPVINSLKIPVTVFIPTNFIDKNDEFWWDKIEQIVIKTKKLKINFSIGKKNYSYRLSDAKEKILAIDNICKELKKFTPSEIQHFVKIFHTISGATLEERRTHLIMGQNDILKLSNSRLVTIGSHAHSHTRLSILSKDQQKKEFILSKNLLQKIIGKDIHFISYPFGSQIDFTSETEGLVQNCGYKAGVANIQKDLTVNDRITAIPRRLVRNWKIDDFISWMKNPDVSDLESRSLKDRSSKF